MSKISAGLAGTLLALSYIGPASAFWRLQCFGVAAVARIDPIVNPGTPGGHVHSIKGGSGLSFTSNAADLLKSECTSCQVSQDHSAYWEPQLYFFGANGSISMVPETAGHLTYYKYTPCYDSEGTLVTPEAMPNDLRIISGDPFRRNFTLPVPDPPLPWSGSDATQEALAQKAIGFNCLNYNKAPEGSLYRHFLPDKSYLDANCNDGLRMEVLFPYCWNGQLDSPDHKSHMAFPDANLNGGKCPPGFDRVTNQLFFETIYPVQNYANDDGYFAFSTGDPTGYGLHGDVLIAWEEGVLKQATEQCGPVTGVGASGITQDCPVFDMVDLGTQASCKIAIPAAIANEEVSYDMKALPGYNPIQTGPEEASKPPHGGSPPPAATSHPASLSGVVPSLSYSSAASSAAAAYAATPAAAGTTPAPAAAGLVALEQPGKGAGAGAGSPPQMGPPKPMTTVYSTNGMDVYELVIMEEDVTVYVTPTSGAAAAAAAKRTPEAVAEEAVTPEKRHGHIHEHVAKRRHEHHPRKR